MKKVRAINDSEYMLLVQIEDSVTGQKDEFFLQPFGRAFVRDGWKVTVQAQRQHPRLKIEFVD